LLQTLQPSDLNLNGNLQHTFVAETLTQFNQILKATTTDIWKAHNDKTIQATAANKLKAKMAALETIDATKATATAIQNALSSINDATQHNANTNLRLANLEKNFRKQEQKTNEISNTIKNNNKNLKQKNYKGSRLAVSATSPAAMTPNTSKATMTHHIVDLTEDENNQYKVSAHHALPQSSTSLSINNGKPSKKQKRQYEDHTTANGKSVQWRSTEELNYYNPLTPVASTNGINHTAQQGQIHSHVTSFMPQPPIPPPPLFPPAPAPTPLLAPSPNPFHNNQQNIFDAGAHNHFLQHNIPGALAQPYQHHANKLQNPFTQQNLPQIQNRTHQKRRKLNQR